MNPIMIIEKKKRGERLSREEIRIMIDGYVQGRIKDYQMAALLMAIWFRGMTHDETADLTETMVRSGQTLHLGPDKQRRVDKHSTGGVGDKVSIALAPLAAACGLRVPMLSGRSLGHTGGTLDKLESIPGYRSQLTPEEMEAVVRKVGCFISGQTDRVAPADRKIYALRDVTGTVDCIPLIVSSILSKKLSEDIAGLVMDVKYGSGAFMTTLTAARGLARALKRTGERLGLRIEALLTPMEEPLGSAVGNALEVIEAVDLLRSDGPHDLLEVTRAIAGEMVLLGGIRRNRADALRLVDEKIASGAAFRVFKKWMRHQGGSINFRRHDLGLDLAPWRRDFASNRSGVVNRIDAREVGQIIVDLGGGRRLVEDKINRGVGMVFHKRVGDRVRSNEAICTIYASDEQSSEMAAQRLKSVVVVGKKSLRIKRRTVEKV